MSGREPLREAVEWLTGRRLGRRRGRPAVPQLDTPWQDTVSPERTGWRQRAANLDGEEVFAVDYRVCLRCGLGWVEQPHTEPELQRCGLAAAGLAALRAEYPGLSWHTLGGHFRDSMAFWRRSAPVSPADTSSVLRAGMPMRGDRCCRRAGC
ncbi:hypothetical protein [Nonomuraea antri]|uniref:hypothetical protein n=1 Tax=Nonomuraea antri TaxID=2730852 RepID=UPI001C2C158E|nr:hypothetical protein [Nonomuraea antri]